MEIESPVLAGFYAQDFAQLWEKANFENTGDIRTTPVPLLFANEAASAQVFFSPGGGMAIDTAIAERVRAAQRRVRICSLLVNSGTLIGARGERLRAGRVAGGGALGRNQRGGV